MIIVNGSVLYVIGWCDMELFNEHNLMVYICGSIALIIGLVLFLINSVFEGFKKSGQIRGLKNTSKMKSDRIDELVESHDCVSFDYSVTKGTNGYTFYIKTCKMCESEIQIGALDFHDSTINDNIKQIEDWITCASKDRDGLIYAKLKND